MSKFARTPTRPTRGAAPQRGSALIVALVFLLAMTLIGVSAMQGTTQEERMAGNMRNRNLAFQAGESALRDGEDWLRPKAILPTSYGSYPCPSPQDCVYAKSTLPDLLGKIQDSSWWVANTHQYGAAATNPEISNVATDPYYTLEEHAFLRDELGIGFKSTPTGRDIYRVTARGTGATDDAKVMLQTTYAKRFN